MGVENNECVIALTWNKAAIESVKNWVKTLSEEKQSLFAFVPALTNGKETVFLAPDGSKKGWATANSIAELRVDFIKLIELLEDFQWVEVGFGEFGQKVLQGNNSNCYSDAEYAGT